MIHAKTFLPLSILLISSLTSASFAKIPTIEISQGETASIKGMLDTNCRSKIKLKVKEKMKLNIPSDAATGSVHSIVNTIQDSRGIPRYNSTLEAGAYIIKLRKKRGSHPTFFPKNCKPESNKFKLDIQSAKFETNDDINAVQPTITLNQNGSTTVNSYDSALPYDIDYYKLKIPYDGFVNAISDSNDTSLSVQVLTDIAPTGIYNDFAFLKQGDYTLRIVKPNASQAIPIELRLAKASIVLNLTANSLVSTQGFIVPSLGLSKNGLFNNIDYSQKYKITTDRTGLIYYSVNGDLDYSENDASINGNKTYGSYYGPQPNSFAYNISNGSELELMVLAISSSSTNINSIYNVDFEFFPNPNDNEGQSYTQPAPEITSLSLNETKKITGSFNGYTVTTHNNVELFIYDTDVYPISIKNKARVLISIQTDNGYVSGNLLDKNSLDDIGYLDTFNPLDIQLKAGEYLLGVSESTARNYTIELSTSKPRPDTITGRMEINVTPEIIKNIDHFASRWRTFISGQGESLDKADLVNSKKILNLNGSYRDFISLKDNDDVYEFSIDSRAVRSILDTTQNIKEIHRNYLHNNRGGRFPYLIQWLKLSRPANSIDTLYIENSKIYKIDAIKNKEGDTVSLEMKFAVLNDDESSDGNYSINQSLPYGRFKLEIK